MWMYFARALRAETQVCAIACVVGLAGCAGAGERLPTCRGTPQPINAGTVAPVAAVVPTASVAVPDHARAH